MRSLLNIVFKSFLFLTCFLYAEPMRYQTNDLIYYLERPQAESYTILIAIEGSYNYTTGPTSVLRLHRKLSQSCLDQGFGLVTMERRGADGDLIDEEIYHRWNTPTQRFKDHARLIDSLRASPPEGWNGQLILLGGSEGGPIAIKLSHDVDPQACIAIVGCTDGTFRESIWNFIKAQRQTAPGWLHSVVNWWYSLPRDREEYDRQCSVMQADPDPKKWWLGQTYLYWADALDQSVEKEFLELKCPLLVIAGSEDISAHPPDRLVQRAMENQQELVYLRKDGMDHDALNPKWGILDAVFEFLQMNLF